MTGGAGGRAAPRRATRLKVIRHRDGDRRLVILARLDGLFSYAEEVRQRVELDPVTREVLGWPATDGLRAESMRLEVDAQGVPTGDAWFQRIAVAGLYDTAEHAEEDALQALAGYRTLH